MANFRKGEALTNFFQDFHFFSIFKVSHDPNLFMKLHIFNMNTSLTYITLPKIFNLCHTLVVNQNNRQTRTTTETEFKLELFTNTPY